MVAGTLFGLASFLASLSLLLMVVGAPLLEIYAHYRAPVLGGGDGVDLYVEAGFYYIFFALLASFLSLLFPTGYAGTYFVDAIVGLVVAIIIGLAEAFVLGFFRIDPSSNNDDELVPVIWLTVAGIVGSVRHSVGDSSAGRSSPNYSKLESQTRRSSSTHSGTGTQGGSGTADLGSDSGPYYRGTGTQGGSGTGHDSTTSSSTATSGTNSSGQSSSAGSHTQRQSTPDADGESDTKVFDPDDSGAGDTEVFTPGSGTGSSHGAGQSSTTCSSCGADLSGYQSVTFCPDCGTKVSSP